MMQQLQEGTTLVADVVDVNEDHDGEDDDDNLVPSSQLSSDVPTAWVAGNYLNRGSSSSCRGGSSSSSSSSSSSCPSIVSRSAWGARAATSSSTMRHPASYVFIHHSDTPTCSSQSACASRVRSIQNHHMNTNKWSDIGYSFLVGGDGSVFEGRGWDRVGAHTKNYNSRGFGICLIGDFMSASPTSAQIASAKRLIACGVSQGKISSGYTLRGHRDVGSTDCPGNVLYNMIRGWPNY